MGKKWKLTGFIFLGSRITADGDYHQEITRAAAPRLRPRARHRRGPGLRPHHSHPIAVLGFVSEGCIDGLTGSAAAGLVVIDRFARENRTPWLQRQSHLHGPLVPSDGVRASAFLLA